jgi:hypothetical protein
MGTSGGGGHNFATRTHRFTRQSQRSKNYFHSATAEKVKRLEWEIDVLRQDLRAVAPWVSAEGKRKT